MKKAQLEGFSQLPHGFHKHLFELSGTQLKVWIAHRSMEGGNEVSWPSLARLSEYTGLCRDAICDARKWLRDNGWLVSSRQTHTSKGNFSVPMVRTSMPWTASVETVYGESLHGESVNSLHGASALTVHGESLPEVDSSCFEVDSREVDSKKKKKGEEKPSSPTQTNHLPSPNQELKGSAKSKFSYEVVALSEDQMEEI